MHWGFRSYSQIIFALETMEMPWLSGIIGCRAGASELYSGNSGYALMVCSIRLGLRDWNSNFGKTILIFLSSDLLHLIFRWCKVYKYYKSVTVDGIFWSHPRIIYFADAYYHFCGHRSNNADNFILISFAPDYWLDQLGVVEDIAQTFSTSPKILFAFESLKEEPWRKSEMCIDHAEGFTENHAELDKYWLQIQIRCNLLETIDAIKSYDFRENRFDQKFYFYHFNEQIALLCGWFKRNCYLLVSICGN